MKKGVTYVLVRHYGLPVILITGKLKTCKPRSLCKPTLSVNSWFRGETLTSVNKVRVGRGHSRSQPVAFAYKLTTHVHPYLHICVNLYLVERS